MVNLYGCEKSPGLQRPSWHCSSEVLLEAHSFPPEHVLVLDLLQFAPQADHSLHPKDVKQMIITFLITQPFYAHLGKSYKQRSKHNKTDLLFQQQNFFPVDTHYSEPDSHCCNNHA